MTLSTDTEMAKVNRRGLVSLKIKEPSTSGYQWQLSEKMKNFKVVSSRIVANKASFGGSADRVMMVKIVENHPELLELVLLRPWSSADVKRRKIFKLEYPTHPSSAPK